MLIDQNTSVQVITTTQIIGIGGVSAIAGSFFTLAGIGLKSFFEAKENKKTRLFEARKNAYSKLMGHLNNSFAKYEFTVTDHDSKTILDSLTAYSVNLDYEFADALLFSSDKVKSKIEEYKNKIYLLKSAILVDKHKQKLQETFSKRVEETQQIFDVAEELIKMMRKELEIK